MHLQDKQNSRSELHNVMLWTRLTTYNSRAQILNKNVDCCMALIVAWPFALCSWHSGTHLKIFTASFCRNMRYCRFLSLVYAIYPQTRNFKLMGLDFTSGVALLAEIAETIDAGEHLPKKLLLDQLFWVPCLYSQPCQPNSLKAC